MRALAILLASLLAAAAARADEAACTPERAGIVACFAGKLCECRYERVQASGLPAGMRWDCGILRPGCAASQPPATLDVYPYPLPPGLSLEQSDTTVTTVTGNRHRVHNGHRGGFR